MLVTAARLLSVMAIDLFIATNPVMSSLEDDHFGKVLCFKLWKCL
jgi:hypothetical protein